MAVSASGSALDLGGATLVSDGAAVDTDGGTRVTGTDLIQCPITAMPTTIPTTATADIRVTTTNMMTMVGIPAIQSAEGEPRLVAPPASRQMKAVDREDSTETASTVATSGMTVERPLVWKAKIRFSSDERVREVSLLRPRQRWDHAQEARF
jgi:hypothetical protein